MRIKFQLYEYPQAPHLKHCGSSHQISSFGIYQKIHHSHIATTSESTVRVAHIYVRMRLTALTLLSLFAL